VVVVAVLTGTAGGFWVLNQDSRSSNGPADNPPSPTVSSVPSPRGELSPDGTTLAFWRDPERRSIRDAPPYVLQVWLSNADGSGQRKIWQKRGCCIVLAPDLRWSKDGSSIVLIIGDHKRRIDVATSKAAPKP
jgi:Tol biopolymer transport system component